MPADNSVAQRMDELRGELSRLADLMSDQALAKKRRRRLTTRSFMGGFVLAGVVFAAYGNLYHAARRQSRQADVLAGQATFVMYQPRKSFLISLLPGDSQNPPPVMLDWLGIDFFSEITNVSTNLKTSVERDSQTVLSELAGMHSVRRLRLTGIICSTLQLDVLADLPHLESLDLTRTRLDEGQMPWLADSRLRWFAAAHTRFHDNALSDLCKNTELQYLNLERSAVSDKSIMDLTKLPALRYVNLRRTPVSQNAIKELAKAMPNCVIDWEPLVLGSPNSKEVRLARRKRIRVGNPMPEDPRVSRRAIAPVDRASTQNPYGVNVWTAPTRYYNNGRMQLDVF